MLISGTIHITQIVLKQNGNNKKANIQDKGTGNKDKEKQNVYCLSEQQET